MRKAKWFVLLGLAAMLITPALADKWNEWEEDPEPFQILKTWRDRIVELTVSLEVLEQYRAVAIPATVGTRPG